MENKEQSLPGEHSEIKKSKSNLKVAHSLNKQIEESLSDVKPLATSSKMRSLDSIKIKKGSNVDCMEKHYSTILRKQKVGSIIEVTKGNEISFGDKKVPRYSNTYRLESDNPFNVEKVEKILHSVMDELIDDELEYDLTETPLKAKQACGLIRSKVKDLKFDRYKLVCIVTLGEKKSQDVYSTVRFLWDVERDGFATYSQENMRMFGIATVFGLYYE